mmetsp:Transcript_27300/g.36527  ORF Transcript_27300/g.36527 Transcript_27300/m.36527 type:complete len:131 (+) Transcript_27300:565-957(+)|eukprot:CAMPEP_0185570226 /NCGR_PEP_ID=MMETSP0434-20130131/2612_1 /TAXON_ID=626734 ORGANISM="Favella taraikaensis, Strain Fe Narragansett Bay" /NCGR_SAMPLE_ID=MMETSP0434 /ASSEMBLY_ACC=CAM_ASM_000379 /LENGTH=130 /DNA_ID=CAMNT_0028185281 /DNA_START=460 /DNA_END=852 /DNA_ORIENTATION=-
MQNDSGPRAGSSELELSKMLEERMMSEMNKKLVQGMPAIIKDRRDPRLIFEQLKAVEGLGLVKALESAAAEYLCKISKQKKERYVKQDSLQRISENSREYMNSMESMESEGDDENQRAEHIEQQKKAKRP